ncbi:hypothetical protein [Planomonospora venezuelensis]|uniref:Uncharacterized protein n=1 Tax=Planomonospora venezuelensis TaxID=1999 RepID=A0A841DDJ3_PLAVE|nr:hypothetical protein [Planomonospora venezuelensis]MBB5967539.1 hypothetical protein [Planomonospora venezuelensis]GIN04791.1 hypothetical protein Pve01_64490 [Planomonospora venezuelensis]
MNTHISTTPARARTDVPAHDRPSAPGGITPSAVRRLGLALTAGTLAWATSIFLFGTVNEGFAERVGDLTGLAFQAGVFALLTIQIRTRATGLSRTSRVMLKVELVLLGLASVWSLLHGLLPEPAQDHMALGVLDAFWPLSMLGMMIISVKLAAAGRWRGPLRWWPLIAESWGVVTVPLFIAFGEGASRWVGGGHLLIGYAALGALLALRPGLVLPRD